MLSKLTVGTVILLIGTVALVSSAKQVQQIEDSPRPFMKRKLDASREIMAGLSLENYDKISKSAQDLMLLSHESEWNVLQTAAYLKLSSEFRGCAQRLRDAANAENLDAATLSFFEVTLNCVRCHKYLRKGSKRP